LALKPKEIQYCEEYLANGFQQRRAYMKIYPKMKQTTADKHAHEIMKKPEVREYIDNRLQDILGDKKKIADKVALSLMEMVEADKKDTIYTPQIRLKAMDLLQKQMGLQTQKIEAEISSNIDITIMGDDLDAD